MNFTIQEHIKHRITGIIVLLSIMLILLPALISKSNERLEKEQHTSLQASINKSKNMAFITKKLAPPIQLATNTTATVPNNKPIVLEPGPVKVVEPKVAIAPRVVAPRVVAPRVVTPKVATPRAVAPRVVAPRAVAPRVVAPRVVTPRVVAPRVVTPRVATPRAVAPRVVAPRANLIKKSDFYAVQLASFSEKQNALKLTAVLRQRGFNANYKIIHERGHIVYKVVVGSMQNRLEALQLQQKLAKAVQLRGFIVQTEVV